LAEWLYEEGIGENRAILIEGGAILEAAIELPGTVRAGAILPARLRSIAGIALLEDGSEAMIVPPAGLTEGAAFNAEILREPIPEAGRTKPAKVRATDEALRAGPTLQDRIGTPPPLARHGADRFEEAGWSELLDEAMRGEIGFPGGALRMAVTPAMTLFDVDGALPLPALAEAGAGAAVRAIRRLDIGGSIGIDLPTLPRDGRQVAAMLVDRLLPQPFERSAVNGFGFLQIVRRRTRPSIPELLRADPAGAAARALLRRAERLSGAVEIRAAPAVVAILKGWRAALERRTGGAARLRAEPGLAIAAGDVQPSQA
jgi:ribonuclease G